MGLAEKLTDNMIGIVVVSILATSLIPLAITQLINLSQIANNPVPALFEN